MSTKKRRNFTPDEKVAILRKSLVENVAVSDLCDQYGLHPTVFYRWQKEFFENGARAFEKKKDSRTARLEKKIARLENKLRDKNDVLSELMEEHVNLKKHLGKSEGHLGTARHQGSGRGFCKILVGTQRDLCLEIHLLAWHRIE